MGLTLVLIVVQLRWVDDVELATFASKYDSAVYLTSRGRDAVRDLIRGTCSGFSGINPVIPRLLPPPMYIRPFYYHPDPLPLNLHFISLNTQYHSAVSSLGSESVCRLPCTYRLKRRLIGMLLYHH
jgi:hypothetical protein